MAPSKRTLVVSKDQIDSMIRSIRGVRVMLDSDLAAIYGVSTKRLNEQVKRNLDRFPTDFMFQLTAKEAVALRWQIATGSKSRSILKSQIAASSSHGSRRSHPYAFTEYGALMAANVLNSERAVQMSVFVIHAFVKMRETLLGTRQLAILSTQFSQRVHTGRMFH
jgi:hypothetical protein